MKKILFILGAGLGMIICLPIILVACIGYLFYVPFDIIRYHRMPYYKDFKNKYQFFITSREVVQIYNRIVREQLPIEYVKNNDYEYFIKDGQVLLCGWSYDDFEKVDGEYFFVLDSECSSGMPIYEALEIDRNLLKPEHRCLPVKYLFFYKDITDAEIFEKAKECPYFHCVFSMDEDL